MADHKEKIEKIKERFERLTGPLILVRSEAYKNSYGSIVGQTEVKYFVTTENLRKDNDYLLSTHSKDLAEFIVNASSDIKYLLELLGERT